MLLLLGCCRVICAGQNTVANGDFALTGKDTIPASWALQSWGPPTGQISVGPAGFSGKSSLRITNSTEEQQTFLVQNIKLEPNTEYRISYFIKGDEIKGSKDFCGGAVYILDQGNSLFSMGTGLYRHAVGTFDWQLVEHVFNTKNLQAKSAALVLSLRQATGSVRFANVQVEKIEKKKEQAVHTDLYPVDLQHQSYHLCRNFPGALLLRMTLERALIPDNSLQLILELPAGIDYLGSVALLPGRDKANNLVFEHDSYEKSETERDGRKYHTYTVTLSPGFTSKLDMKYSWENYTRIYLQSNGEPGEYGKAYWKLRSKTTEFPEQSFTVTVLPPLELPKKACENFQLCVARLWNMNAPPGVSDAYINYWTSLQKRPWTSDPYYINAYPETERQKVYDNFHYTSHLASSVSMPWMGPLYNAVAENRFPGKFPKSVRTNGEEIPVSISPWYLIEDPENLIWGTLFDEYAEGIRKNPHIKAIAIDYEPGVNHCYSQASRERFRKFANLSEVPATSEIIAKYRNEWLKFRIEQHRLILQRLSQAIRSKLPGIRFWLISDPLQTGSQRVAEWCGVDVKASDPDIDMHQDMPYFAGLQFFENIKLNVTELEKPCFPLIDPSENMDMYYQRYSPEKVRQNILCVAALGGYGIGFWPNDVFDGRYLEAIKEGFRIVAEVEHIYAAGALPENSFSAVCRNVMAFEAEGADGQKVKITLPRLDQKIRVLRHRANETEVLTIFNFSDTLEAVIELTLPDANAENYRLHELVSGQKGGLSGNLVRNGFLLNVPANGLAVLKLDPGTADNAFDQTASTEILKKFQSGSIAEKKFKSFRHDNTAAYWGMVKDTDKAILFLEQGKGRLGIAALDDGEVLLWQPDGTGNNDVLYFQNRGFLGRFMFNSPDQLAAPYPFELTGIERKGNSPAASFEYQVPDYANASALKNPLTGLMIRKTITLTENGRECQLDYHFRNPTEAPMEFSFRVNNFPRLGGNIAGNKPLNTITTVNYGGVRFTPGSPTAEKLILDAPDGAKELRRNVIFGRIPVEVAPPTAIELHANNAVSEKMTISVEPPPTGIYSWSDTNVYTVEPISQEITLPPGKTLSWRCSYKLTK